MYYWILKLKELIQLLYDIKHFMIIYIKEISMELIKLNVILIRTWMSTKVNSTQ
ncbi:unnamed protein product [Schistosoma curassoni]|uniref:Uncharacterized protein n=1 Tax=Schistosoma curassoni TaxID=6186 RepID=A0A183L1N8_9TREM|nr:unnamed protein product [Schistosoma curassoni]